MSAPIPNFEYDPEHNANDAEVRSATDFEDLRNVLARRGSFQDVAIFLCRQGSQDAVRRKAEEIGWWPSA